jgi:hypothetical protein
MSIQLPEHVKIGPFLWEVNERTKDWMSDADAWGNTCFERLTINVVTDRSDWHSLDTFIHEIGHGIWDTYKIEDEDKEERIVATMAVAWTQIFRDNPDVLRYINEVIKHG